MLVKRSMAAVDHAWLRMDTPENPAVSQLVMCFAGEIPLAAVADALRRSLVQYHQFTHRVQRGWLRSCWVSDPQFCISRHLDELHLPAGSGKAGLEEWISSQGGKPLPSDRPLWHATLVHGVGGGSALVIRVHHSLTDGIGLSHLINRVTDGEQSHPTNASVREGLSDSLLVRAQRVMADALHLMFMRRDKASRLKGRSSHEKSVAWSEALSLQAVRDLAHRYGATVNDVVLAVIANALRCHLHTQGQSQIDGPLRAIVPVNLRSHSEAHLLGNCFGLVGLDIPVHLDDPLERLSRVRDGMTGLKRGFQAKLAFALVRFAGLLPARVQTALLSIFTRRCTVAVTNWIGPSKVRSLGGVRMDELVGLAPSVMSIGGAVTIVSYNGELRVGFFFSQNLMPDAHSAAASVRTGFEQLRHSAIASIEESIARKARIRNPE